MKKISLKQPFGFWLLLVTLVVTIVAAVMYPGSAFSSDYAPLGWVETVLILTCVLECATLAGVLFLANPWLNIMGILFAGLSFLALAFSFLPNITPIAYVISGLTTFEELSAFVYTAAVMGCAAVLNLLGLFFPLVRTNR